MGVDVEVGEFGAVVTGGDLHVAEPGDRLVLLWLKEGWRGIGTQQMIH